MPRLILLLIFLHFFSHGFTQWSSTNGPLGGRILSLCASNTRIYAGSGTGIWVSTDSGTTWSLSSQGIPTTGVLAITAGQSDVWVGLNDAGIYTSADDGAHWTSRSTGLTNLIVKALVKTGTTLFAGTVGGLFVSEDSGDHWLRKEGLIAGVNISSLVLSGTSVIAGSYGKGIFVSGDQGLTWQNPATSPSDPFIISLASNGPEVIAGTEGGKIYISTDGGNTWLDSSNGFPAGMAVTTLEFSGYHILAGTAGQGVFRSIDNGNSWSAFNTNLTNLFIHSMVVSANRILIGTDGGGIFISDESGSTWHQGNEGLTGTSVKVMMSHGSNIIAGTSGAGLFISYDNGYSWAPRNNGISNRFISAIEEVGDTLFAGTSGAGLLVSDNQGISWIASGNGIWNSYITTLYLFGSDLFAGTSGSGIFISEDSGMTWSAASSGIPDSAITTITSCKQQVFAGTQSSGVFSSVDHGNTWSATNKGLSNLMIITLAGQGSSLFAATPTGLFRLSMPDTSWAPLLFNDKEILARSIYFFGNAVFAGTEQNGVLLSIDDGHTWKMLNEGLIDNTIQSVAATPQILFAGTRESGIWKRPLSEVFINKIFPDTIVLKQTQNFLDTLHIVSTVDWSIQGNIPDWFTLNKKNGTGTDTIVFRSLKPNQGYLPRTCQLYLYSPVAPTLFFTVLQLGKSAGLEDDKAPVEIRISPGQGIGIVMISATSEIKNITIYTIKGEMIREIHENSRNIRIDLSSFVKGISILKISGDGWTTCRKYKL